MIEQQKLKIGTLLVSTAVAGLIGYQVVAQPKSGQTAASSTESGQMAKLEPKQFGSSDTSYDVDDSNSKLGSKRGGARSSGALRVGRIGATPTLNDIKQLQSLPLLESQVKRAYSSAKAMTCRMLTSGSAVKPSVSMPNEGESGTVGRVAAFTIGLAMDSQGRSKLPAVTRGQVDEYFAKHRLSIQPIVYCGPSGQLYFGTDCQAAFFEVDRPGIAVRSEPMIESAVERFRSLGVTSSTEETSSGLTSRNLALDEAAGRTLVMAFTFEKSDLTISAVGAPDRQVTELLFFHLPLSSLEEVRKIDSRHPIPIEVYLTSDERRSLHRLDLQGSDLNSPLATIDADVRFDKMILMGLYPAEPVVTDIHFRSAGTISMELVSQLMEGMNGQPAISLDELLDQFGLLSGSQRAGVQVADEMGKTIDGKLDRDDERWIREIARQKYERLEKTLNQDKRDAPPLVLPKIRLMTGASE
ncbi:hypothetical protein [Neorhodopirellula lusitana]|uniref:hypothetical protein n=1 Tax=Neorhodopirellula lusitana TaxID=445327 RepID=UPI00384CBF96